MTQTLEVLANYALLRLSLLPFPHLRLHCFFATLQSDPVVLLPTSGIMLTDYLYSSYKQYESDTNAIGNWLAKTAQKCGYSIESLSRAVENKTVHEKQELDDKSVWSILNRIFRHPSQRRKPLNVARA